MDLIVLLDRSGSAHPVTQKHIDLVREIEARAEARQVAVYGFSSGGSDGAHLAPLKALDGSFDEAALHSIPAGGTPTADAIDKVAKLHDPARLIVVTDGLAYKPGSVAKVIAGLPAGWEVYGLQVDIHPAGRQALEDLETQFGRNWVALEDGKDRFSGLDAALSAPIEPRLSQLGEAPAPESPESPAPSGLSVDR